MTGRTSRWFPHDPIMWLQSTETNLLIQDFNLHIVPYRDNKDAYELFVDGIPKHKIRESLRLWNRGRGADSFVSTVASTLLTEHEVWLEIVFEPDGPNGLPFIPLIVNGVRQTATGRLIQEVPVPDAPNLDHHDDTTMEIQVIKLDDERMVRVELPEKYPSQLLAGVTYELVETDQYDPIMSPWIMQSITAQRRGGPVFDVGQATLTKRLRTVQATRPIGWTAREMHRGGDSPLSNYYLYWREFQFLHFRSSMREQAEQALGAVLRMAGAKFGFKASVTTSGLFTPPEVAAIIRDYESGKVTFSAANDIAFERPDNVYSRERQLF